jgi:uncharacterized protein (DUF2235 family)
MKRLIVCCDGTWQKLDSQYPTNVVKIAQAIKPLCDDNTQQIIFYDEGIGTGDRLDRIFGGAFGWGIDQNIQDAYRFLSINYQPGDEIYLYGFSRGAYTVRSLAGLIRCSGLLERNKIRQAGKAYEIYRNNNIEPDDKAAIEFRQKNSNDVRITLLGCWDTVGALGIPDRIPILPVDDWINEKYKFHDTYLSSIIDNALHAVAIDEIREVFDVTRMQKSTNNSSQSLKQIWFPGTHGCVGGGSQENSGLSDGALLWMIEESQRLGIEFDTTKIIKGINPNPRISFDNELKGIFKAARTHLRRVDENEANLHQSVIDRWSALKEHYRPKNLAIHLAYLDDMSNNLLNIA